jgi:hypothetical protein
MESGMSETYLAITLSETNARDIVRIVRGYRMKDRSGLSAGERVVLRYLEVLIADALGEGE